MYKTTYSVKSPYLEVYVHKYIQYKYSTLVRHVQFVRVHKMRIISFSLITSPIIHYINKIP